MSFGFSSLVCRFISKCVEAPWYSVMMNGNTKGFFKSKGDDHLSCSPLNAKGSSF